jgi:quinol monooxygenase YgiN
MHIITVTLTAKNPEDAPKLAGLLAEQGRLSRAEPGCIQFDVCQSQSDPAVFFLLERWDRKESWEVHRTARSYTEIYQPQVIPLVDRVAHVCQILT